MDLEELKEDLQIQLTEIQNQIADLKSVSKTSTNSQTDLMIFSELRKVLKEQNEQGEKNLNKNAEKLNENAKSVYNELSNNANSKLNELKVSVEKTQTNLQNGISQITKSIGGSVSQTLKSVEQNCINANNQFLESVKNGKADVAKAVAEQRRAIFKFWGSCVLFIFIGIGASALGILSWNWFKIQDAYYKDLAEQKKLESIQKEAVEDYKKKLTSKEGIVELKELEYEWAKDEDNVTWQDREKTLQSFKKNISTAKEWIK